MHVLLGLIAVIGAIGYFILRAQNTVKAAKELDYETRGMQRRAKSAFTSIFGTKLGRVRDPKLGAVILMIQLVRTGSPVTAAEKQAILDLMEDPLRIPNRPAMFEQAWGYTQQRAFFSMVSDELLPMFRENLTQEERLQLIDMLQKTADSYHEASDLQQGAINRFTKRLLSA